jgi:uncharacterized protein YrzB (UPF0473 family)
MINIINELGVTENVNVVRFFKANNASYLMYTLSEKDEAGYIKLYASKMLDSATFSKIEDDEEWNSVKELIKVIVKETKDNSLVSVEDLDYIKLDGIKVLGTRVFKLTEQVAEMLGSNKKTFVVETPKIEETPILAEPTPVLLEEVEAQSFEELLSQSAPKLEELVFETPKVEEAVLEVIPATETLKIEETPVVSTPIVEPLAPVSTMEPTKKLSTLEELLGQYSEEPLIEEVRKEVETVSNVEVDVVKKLEAKILELETKINKISEILK